MRKLIAAMSLALLLAGCGEEAQKEVVVGKWAEWEANAFQNAVKTMRTSASDMAKTRNDDIQNRREQLTTVLEKGDSSSERADALRKQPFLFGDRKEITLFKDTSEETVLEGKEETRPYINRSAGDYIIEMIDPGIIREMENEGKSNVEIIKESNERSGAATELMDLMRHPSLRKFLTSQGRIPNLSEAYSGSMEDGRKLMPLITEAYTKFQKSLEGTSAGDSFSDVSLNDFFEDYFLPTMMQGTVGSLEPLAISGGASGRMDNAAYQDYMKAYATALKEAENLKTIADKLGISVEGIRVPQFREGPSGFTEGDRAVESIKDTSEGDIANIQILSKALGGLTAINKALESVAEANDLSAAQTDNLREFIKTGDQDADGKSLGLLDALPEDVASAGEALRTQARALEEAIVQLQSGDTEEEEEGMKALNALIKEMGKLAMTQATPL